jgi:hypothetical protein
MSGTDQVFQQAVANLLVELFDGPPGREAFVLNPGDPGLLRQLAGVDEQTASTRPMPGLTTIAAHVDHVHYGFTLMNRWAAGEPSPWASADWNASWRRGTVNEQEWRALRDKLAQAAAQWKQTVRTREAWNGMSAAGAIASAAHTAYHLGAIRQLLAAHGRPPASV